MKGEINTSKVHSEWEFGDFKHSFYLEKSVDFQAWDV
ncbi:hypothetical protein SAMN05518670_1034 [Paenibacillus sp. OK076]|nr:hypothetical protein SAMN05518670_1034 [Paenibacillus sp. OK076]